MTSLRLLRTTSFCFDDLRRFSINSNVIRHISNSHIFYDDVCFLYSIHSVLHFTVLYCTVLYCTVLYCTVLCRGIYYCTILCCDILSVILRADVIPLSHTSSTSPNSLHSVHLHPYPQPLPSPLSSNQILILILNPNPHPYLQHVPYPHPYLQPLPPPRTRTLLVDVLQRAI